MLIPRGIPILATLLLLASCGSGSSSNGSGSEPAGQRDQSIYIEASNCAQICQSFSMTIKPDGAISFGAFHTWYNSASRAWMVKFEGAYRAQLDATEYDRFRNAIDELKVEDLEQQTGDHALQCADSREPRLQITSETQLDHYYLLYLSCPEHRDVALQLGNLAMEMSDGVVELEDWPLDKSQAP